jgi:hypothetical protein
MPDLVRKFEQMVSVSGGGPGPPPAAAPPTDKEKIDWLYSILTILDAKAGALLSFNGLLLAAASLMYNKIADAVPWLRVPSLLLILVILLAAALCLLVAQMSYPFLGAITLGTRSNANEIAGLERAVDIRTHRLRSAWRVSIGVVLLFMCFIIVVVLTALDLI